MRNIIRNGIVGHHIINKNDRGKEVTGKILPAILTEQVRLRKLYVVWWPSAAVKFDSFYEIRAEKIERGLSAKKFKKSAQRNPTLSKN